MNSSLVLPILFQLSAFCPQESNAPTYGVSLSHRAGHHKRPIPPPEPPQPVTGRYDPTAFSDCRDSPSGRPLYDGGILKNPTFDNGIDGWTPFGSCTLQLRSQGANKFLVATNRNAGFQGPSQSFNNITLTRLPTAWLQVHGTDSALVKATVKSNGQYITAGHVMAKEGCWSFLKGGFIPESNASLATLYFESRTRQVSVSVTDCKGKGISNAEIKIEQITGDFPFGSAIASTILDNPTYQKWFVTRFNTAVFENEMKWYSTERERGKVSYETADRMLAFCRANDIFVRGHNVFWDDPQYQPGWVKNLSADELKEAAYSRLQSVVSYYAGKLPQWDVLNEMLHFDFFESKLGPDAGIDFYKMAHEIDPKATLFLNDYNVIETPQDPKSSPDAYIQRILELKDAGVPTLGIGLEGHFSAKPNLVYMRAVLDKLATLGLPIWLTEVDIMNTVDPESQATYLRQILLEAFAHPAVKGIVLWTALHPYGCYRMCLTDNNFKNLPAGNIVDVFLKNIRTANVSGVTDETGSFSFRGYHGQYQISVSYNQTSIVKRLAISNDADVQTIHVLVS